MTQIFDSANDNASMLPVVFKAWLLLSIDAKRFHTKKYNSKWIDISYR